MTSQLQNFLANLNKTSDDNIENQTKEILYKYAGFHWKVLNALTFGQNQYARERMLQSGLDNISNKITKLNITYSDVNANKKLETALKNVATNERVKLKHIQSLFKNAVADENPMQEDLQEGKISLKVPDHIEKFEPSETPPSIDELLEYIGFDQNNYSIVSTSPSNMKFKANWQLTPLIMENITSLNTYFKNLRLEAYRKINENLAQFSVENNETFRKLPEEMMIFIHTTPVAKNLLENNAEFKGSYLSASLYSPNEKHTGLYHDRKGVGLILEIPPEAIAAAHREDLNIRPSDFDENFAENYLLESYQRQILNQFVENIYIRSGLRDESGKKGSKIERYQSHREKFMEIEKNYFSEGEKVRAIGHSTARHRLEKLMIYYDEALKNMDETQQEKEFQRLFQRPGKDIREALKKMYQAVQKHNYMIEKFEGVDKRKGKIHTPEKAVKGKYETIVSHSEHNELVVLTPQKCKQLKIASPNIKGILVYESEMSKLDPQDQETVKLAFQKNIPVYYAPFKK